MFIVLYFLLSIGFIIYSSYQIYEKCIALKSLIREPGWFSGSRVQPVIRISRVRVPVNLLIIFSWFAPSVPTDWTIKRTGGVNLFMDLLTKKNT